LLGASLEVFQEFSPELGVLFDLPQITVKPGDTAHVCRLAKEDPRLALRQLLCLACVDYRDHFQLVYFLHSLAPDRTLVVKTNVSYDDPHLPSVSSIWRAGEWYEREAHDLFGVVFDGHPGLAPLLLYDGFEGYPGRKEFPFNDYQEF
jgi:NADH-quinone oxidoreductase subunit C